jgi:N-acetylglucosaminyldiphosphoundecaprenol N-acetyl-beta-D-mannosaminyltransferase
MDISPAPMETHDLRCRTCVGTPRPKPGSIFVNGIRIDPQRPSEFLESIGSFLACGEGHVIHFLPADPIVLALTDKAYRKLLNNGDLNLPDGMAVVWAVRWRGLRAERLAGTEGFHYVAQWGLRRDLAHFVYGGSAEVNTEVVRRLRADHPGIRIAGAKAPPFRDLTDAEIAEEAELIRASGADVVWIGLGTPKQDVVGERFRAHHAAPAIFCVGAAFDFVSGAKARAPEWMKQAGLEWAFRLLTEPRRLWKRYLLGNPLFLFALFRRHLRSGLARSRAAFWRKEP